ncbi:MAG TPA: phosphocholine cytidylyltransferase family protein [Rhodospirillales bacterium]|nr:phosphocholine cytidylyltransferase family protein [Rhodospirillales bacterium]
MKVVMLAAGIGARLGFTTKEPPAKVLLRFGGKSLLQYHIDIFRRHGIDELVLGVGHHHQDIEREIAALGAQDFVRTVFNENYDEGNIVTLWTLRDELCCGKPVLLMDADVLYDEELLERLLNSRHQNCLLLDRSFEPGDEPVKICVRDGEIIEFRKWQSAEFDFSGESVGFFKLSAEVAKKIIIQTELYLRQGHRQEPYEETIRDVLLTSPRGTFAFEDITGVPWIEIDFAADIECANTDVLPRILMAESKRHAPILSKRDMVRGERQGI